MSREAGAQPHLAGARLDGDAELESGSPGRLEAEPAAAGSRFEARSDHDHASPAASGDAPQAPGAPGAGSASSEAPSGPLGGVLQVLTERHVIRSLLAAIAAWATTIAPAAFARGSPPIASLLATAALFVALAGPIVAYQRRRLGRHLGISVFLALATATWLVASTALQPSRLDPTRAAIGALAWAAFALTWSDPWKFRRPTATDIGAPALQGRATLPPYAVPIAGIGVAAGFVCLALAWRIRDGGRALLGQSTALACALALITVSATVAIARGKRQLGGQRRMTGAVIRPLILLATFAIAGAVVLMIR